MIKFLFVAMFAVFLSGCLISSNYYTAKTVESGHTTFRPGFDNFAIKLHGDDWNLAKDNKPIFTPSLGIIRGLPGRFELGGTFYFPSVVEGILRWQINPKSFTAWDMSLNGHYGYAFVFCRIYLLQVWRDHQQGF